MNNSKFAPQMRVLTVSAILLSATITLAQRNQNRDKLHVGIVSTQVLSVDPSNNSFVIKYNNVETTITLQVNMIFMNGGARSQPSTFFNIAPGKAFYINICDVQPKPLTDMIWDGVSFAAYKKDAESFSGIVKQQVRDTVRVEDKVYKITDSTKFYMDDRPSNKSAIHVGQWAAVTGAKYKVTPEATVIKVWKEKPSTLGDKVNGDDKRESQGAKDKLKNGVGSMNPPGLNKNGKKIGTKGGKSSTATGANGKTRKGGGQ